MADVNLEKPETAEVEVDRVTLAEIDQALEEVKEGRSVPLEDVRKLIPDWISKFGSRNRR